MVTTFENAIKFANYILEKDFSTNTMEQKGDIEDCAFYWGATYNDFKSPTKKLSAEQLQQLTDLNIRVIQKLGLVNYGGSLTLPWKITYE